MTKSLPILFFILIFGITQSIAQCTSPISNFPYLQDFEANNGGWVAGGNFSDWAWGKPNKTVITSALSSKCWITGGLTGNLYNVNELSWVQSPCFDFTNNQYPYLKFKVFWETEKKFDGALLQYSINGGTTWATLGSVADAVDCLNGNWYNYTPVTYLTPPTGGANGWSGSVANPTGCPSTSGSGGWVTAQHTFPILAGKPSVIFRFLFGAGSICNNFNGFAFDDFFVDVAPPNAANFTYTCTNSNTVSFTNTSTLCPTLSWNFGDPTSGANNTSTAQTPSHTYATPGTYTVTLNAVGNGNAPSTITKNITILGVNASVVTPLNCSGNAIGSVTTTVTGSAGPFTYSWNTSPIQQTQTATNLAAGTYIVSVSAANTCTNTASVTLVAPATIAAPTTTPVEYCQNTSAVALTANGSNLLWYANATGGTGSSSAPTPSTTTVGNVTYFVSQMVSGCESPRASLVVTIKAIPAAPAVTSPLTYCHTTVAPILTATGSGLLWYANASGGAGSSSAPTPSTATVGNTNYYVSQTINGCESPRANIVVNITATTAAPIVTSPIAYCQNTTATALTATGTNLLWYANASGGTGSSTAPIPSTTTAGSTIYYVSQTLSCGESPRAAIIVTINAVPTIVTSPVNYCQGATAVALTATGSGLLWYANATGGTGSCIAPIPSTNIVGTTNYYVSSSNGSCSSNATCESPRAALPVTISQALTVFAGNDTTINLGTTIILNGSSTGTASPIYSWTSSINPITLNATNIPKPLASPSEKTTYTLKVTDPTGLCPSVVDDVTISIVQKNCINIRNAFTPNGDGINDLWKVYDQRDCLTKEGCKVNVYNRYGSKVFESANYYNTWQGTYNDKPIPDGTYYAVITFTFLDGSIQIVRTDVTVLR